MEIANLSTVSVVISMTEDSTIIFNQRDQIWGCGSNAHGQLSAIGIKDTSDHVLHKDGFYGIVHNNDVLQIGSTKHNHFFRTKSRIFMTGSCPYKELCVYTKVGGADLNYTHLQLPIEAENVQEMLVYPDTVAVIDYANKVYILG